MPIRADSRWLRGQGWLGDGTFGRASGL